MHCGRKKKRPENLKRACQGREEVLEALDSIIENLEALGYKSSPVGALAIRKRELSDPEDDLRTEAMKKELEGFRRRYRNIGEGFC